MEPKYIRSLDGVRAVACLLVLSDHLGYTGFGGWVGVQLFFVLSGFLITRILLEYKGTGTGLGSYLKVFYTRRALRIFPVYYLMLFVLFATFAIWGWPQVSGRGWAYLLTYTYNFASLDPQIVTLPPPFQVMGHTWSLSLEEQFYLVWPLLVFFTSRKMLKRVAFAMVIFVPVLRFFFAEGAMAYFTHLGVALPHVLAAFATYQFPLSQVDAFAFGALIVLADMSWVERPKKAFWLLGGVTFVLGVINAISIARQHLVSPLVAIYSLGYPGNLEHNYQYVWGYTIVDALAMLLVFACVRKQPIFGWLENRFMVRIGKISYGVYLFHRPIHKLAIRYFPYDVRQQPRALIITVVLLVIVYVVAEASYRLFETRFLLMKERTKQEPAARAADAVVNPSS